jgi:hypothetical protein
MAYSFYIYYRIDLARSANCERRIQELFAAVRKATGVAGQLMKKRGESNLWMEIYLNVTDDVKFERELAQAAAGLNIAEFLVPGTPRRTECFEH